MSESWYRDIAEGLKGHPDALLAFALALAAVGLVAAGVEAWLACVFTGTLYIAYRVKGLLTDLSKERIARGELERLEMQRAVTARRPIESPPDVEE